MVLFRRSCLTHLSPLIHHRCCSLFQVAVRQRKEGPLIDKRVSRASSARSPSMLGRLWWGGEEEGRRCGRKPGVQALRLVPEWEVTTAGEPVAVSPKCSIFRDAGMQIKCQLAGKDMKHWQYQLLKSLYLEQSVCVLPVMAGGVFGGGGWRYSGLQRKYIPYLIYQPCLGQYFQITSSVSHKLGNTEPSQSWEI